MSTRPLDHDDPRDPGREDTDYLEEEELPVLEVWEPYAENAPGPETPEVIELPPPDQTPRAPDDDTPQEPPEPAPPQEAPGEDEPEVEAREQPLAAEAPVTVASPPPDEEPAAGNALRPGEVLAGRFEILQPLPFDGPGSTYAILDRYIQDREALRILPEKAVDARVRARLEREVRAARSVKHPGIAALFEAGEDPDRGLSFVTMELVEGKTLAEVLRERGGRLPVWEAFDVARRLCEALGAAHRHTAHLGLNPHNVVLLPDGAVKVLDLGLAAALPRHALLQAAAAGGTQPFLAPELKNAFIEGDRRADVYSIGALFYLMLTGITPGNPVVPPSHLALDVPAGIDKIVLQCLRRRPEERPRDVRAVEKALQRALVPPKGRPLLWAAIAASLLALVAAVLLPKLGTDRSGAPATRVASRTEPRQPAPRAVDPPVARVEPAAKVEPAPQAEPPAPPAGPATDPQPEPVPVTEVAAEPVPKPVPAPSLDPASVPAPPPLADAPKKPANVPVWPEEAELPPVRPAVPPAPQATARATPDRPSIAVTEPVPVEPADNAPAVTGQANLPPQVRAARAGALRARTEALAVGADSNAGEPFAQGLNALNEADGWVNAGWTDDAAEQYRLAERRFRRAIDETLNSSHVIGPDGGFVASPEPTAPAPDAPPARPAASPAHSLQLARITGGGGTTYRAEIVFNLLGGGRRTQAFKVGDEVADGWRVESLDPANATARLRNGNRVTVLSAQGTLRTTAPAAEPASQADYSRAALDVGAAIRDWVRTAEAREAGAHSALYADTVASYFNSRDVPRRAVYADKLNFFGKYDRIDLDVRNLNVRPRADGSVVATFDKRWDAQGPGTSFSGDERQELVLKKVGGEWKIVSEREVKVYWTRR